MIFYFRHCEKFVEEFLKPENYSNINASRRFVDMFYYRLMICVLRGFFDKNDVSLIVEQKSIEKYLQVVQVLSEQKKDPKQDIAAQGTFYRQFIQ
jgi:hypothetical protein